MAAQRSAARAVRCGQPRPRLAARRVPFRALPSQRLRSAPTTSLAPVALPERRWALLLRRGVFVCLFFAIPIDRSSSASADAALAASWGRSSSSEYVARRSHASQRAAAVQVSFDSLGPAMLTVFQCITLAGYRALCAHPAAARDGAPRGAQRRLLRRAVQFSSDPDSAALHGCAAASAAGRASCTILYI